MENYRIYFEPGEEDDILEKLRRYNDIVIDNINTNSIGITIERDDAEVLYLKVMDRLDREVYSFRPHLRYSE